MFNAILLKDGSTIGIDEVENLSDEFGCLNPTCTARYKPKAINSRVSKHFAKIKSSVHVQGCLFDGGNRFVNSDKITKSPIQEIFNKAIVKNPSLATIKRVSTKKTSSESAYIRTPKQLLAFCLANSLSTIYDENNSVDDIIIDRRNLIKNGRFEGISGLRLLYGETVGYNNQINTLDISISAVSRLGKKLTLYAVVYLSSEQLQKIKKYIFGTHPFFKGHHIAVLAEWDIVTLYHVEATIRNPAHIIYKFAE